ncbi:MAG: hypothetical protein AB7P50_08260 [Alphaproteobacteria bacterium]
MKTTLLTVALLGLLALAASFAYFVWDDLADAEMSTHGWIALALGVVFSVGLGGGLMWLIFYSARKGHDDKIN